MSVQELESNGNRGFGNVFSLINRKLVDRLIAILVSKWEPKGKVFRFGIIKRCPTLDEYARLSTITILSFALPIVFGLVPKTSRIKE